MSVFFLFNDTSTTEIYTLSLHDALPISLLYLGPLEAGTCRIRQVDRGPARRDESDHQFPLPAAGVWHGRGPLDDDRDRKSTRLNSSHANISYAVFCLKKKNK